MNQAAKTEAERASSGEAHVHPEELRISRTDARGVIQAANGAFRRQAGHDWESLIGAPHGIIRHPDMPCGVFHLFWERLKAGREVGAYVKNREASGRHYWVFAVALPVPEGYVSVHLEPTSPLFAKIPALYSELRKAETQDGVGPGQSSDPLSARLPALGFDGYEDFMAEALCTEFSARAELLARPLERSVAHARETASAIHTARCHAKRVAMLFDEIRNVPTNIRILAAQLEEGSGPIGVISTNHTSLSEEMLNSVDAFQRAATATYSAIAFGLFRACSAALLQECAEGYRRETDLPVAIDGAREARTLSEASRRCATEAEEAMVGVSAEVTRFADVAGALKRHVAGLDVARIMCKIENARFRPATTSLTEIIDNLEENQAQIGDQLSEIEKAAQSILNTARRASVQRVA
ncbi:PAS domain-containing protein [Rhodosalinus halophilus]|nr:PAS domain-containing protein [Rhodosalinus halophilus]